MKHESTKRMCILTQIIQLTNAIIHIIHSTIKMKPVDVKYRTYIDSNKENNKGDSKFKVDDHVKIHSKLVWRGFCD